MQGGKKEEKKSRELGSEPRTRIKHCRAKLPSTCRGHGFRKGATTAKTNAQQQQRLEQHLSAPKGRHAERHLNVFNTSAFGSLSHPLRLGHKLKEKNPLKWINSCFDTAGLQASLHTATLSKYLTPLAVMFMAKQNHPCYKARDNCHN